MDLSRRYATVVLGLVFVFASLGYGQADPNTEKRINALISRMTLAEKLGQLQQLDSEGNGSAHPEEFEMVRKGLLGSTLGVRGAKRSALTVRGCRDCLAVSLRSRPRRSGHPGVHQTI